MYATATVRVVCTDCRCTVNPAYHACTKDQRPIAKVSAR